MATTNKPVTIKSIAKELNVSFSTVSKALNNNPAIKEETRLLVLNKANEMGYTPNSLAKGLRGESTKTIAIIFNDIENPVLTYIFRDIAVTMAKQGFTTMIFDSQFSEKIERANIQAVLSRLPDFIIIEPTSMNPANLQLLSDVANKLIVHGAHYENISSHHVHVDYAQGGYLAASHLLSQGHRDCLVITETLNFPTSRDYVSGIKKAFDEYGIAFSNDRIKVTSSSIMHGFQVIQSLWDIKKQAFSIPLTAVMTFDDNLAYGVYKAAMQYNFTIPGDISVIGFDNNPLSLFSTPPLTTMQLPKEKIAENHINILRACLLKGRSEMCFYSSEPTLMDRGSVKNLLQK